MNLLHFWVDFWEHFHGGHCRPLAGYDANLHRSIKDILEAGGNDCFHHVFNTS